MHCVKNSIGGLEMEEGWEGGWLCRSVGGLGDKATRGVGEVVHRSLHPPPPSILYPPLVVHCPARSHVIPVIA